MTDPVEDLERFRDHQPPTHPLPAAEVRRRGDRRRRRQTALASLGGVVAAALVIGVPFAVVSGRDDRTTPDPAPAPTTPTQVVDTAWQQQVPVDFPLADGLDPTGADADGVRVGPGASTEDLVLCAAPAWTPTAPVAASDVRGAEARLGGEQTNARSLAVYADEAAAAAALDDLRTALAGCRLDDETGTRATQEFLVADTTVPGAEDSLVFAQRSLDGSGETSGDRSVWLVVRAGNALLLDQAVSAGGSGDDELAAAQFDRITATAGVVADLCVFSAEPCGSVQPDEDPALLDRVDLAAGLPAANDDGSAVSVTSAPGVLPATLEWCGTRGWDRTGVTGLRGVRFDAPEDYRARTLAVYADDAAAGAALARLDAALAACPEDSSGDAGSSLHQRVEVDLGDEAVGFTERYQVAGAGIGPGLTVYEFVRVGRALLLVSESGEGGGSDQIVASSVTRTTQDARDAVASMCVLAADAGC